MHKRINPSPLAIPFRARLWFVVTVACLVLATGCTRPVQTTKAVSQNRESEDSFSVADTFRKATDIESGRNAVQQLNLYIGNHPDLKPAPLGKEESDTLRDQFALDPSDLAEVQSSVFTVLDAQHLQTCMLFRDAIRSLRIEDRSPLEKAKAGFDWVVRQVGIEERPGDSFPPNFVLRRGWGTALERAFVFMAVLEQLGLEGCMVAVPATPQEQDRMSYWIPGVLIEKEIHLFDTRLGLPLPGPKGEGVTTLTQVRAQPEILKDLSANPKLAYDVSPDQLKKVELLVACSLPAMSPRMKYLHEVLSPADGIKLWGDPVGSLKRFEQALGPSKQSGSRVRGWNQPGDINTPVRIVRYFLPQSDGGLDSSGRRDRAIAALLVPWRLYPNDLKRLEGEPGMRLQGLFGNPYPIFTLEAKMPKASLQSWLPGLYDPATGGASSQKASDLVERERMPRDLMLHGRVEEATNVLITIRDELVKQRAVEITPKKMADIRRWCQEIVEAYGTYLRLEKEARDPKSRYPVDPAALENARKMKDTLWAQAHPIMDLVQKSSAVYMVGEVTYLVALCKQEQAVRAQSKVDQAKHAKKSASPADVNSAKSAWTAAAGWWNTYLEEYGTARGASAARLFKARALCALGEPDQARALLNESSTGQSTFETIARLYLAKQLDGRKQ